MAYTMKLSVLQQGHQNSQSKQLSHIKITSLYYSPVSLSALAVEQNVGNRTCACNHRTGHTNKCLCSHNITSSNDMRHVFIGENGLRSEQQSPHCGV